MSSLLVTGSIGIDNVVTPHGAVHDVLGGSAVYFSWAAAAFCRVRLVAVVGEDFPSRFARALAHPNIDTRGLERRRGSKTFRWSGRYDATLNEATTTAVALNVLAESAPQIPPAFADSDIVFLAATHPHLQLRLLSQLTRPKLVLADTRDLWIRNYLQPVRTGLKQVDGLMLNDLEARLLTGQVNLVAALQRIRGMLKPSGPRLVVLKKGEHGCLAAFGNDFFPMPAFPTAKVLDPTGAGDSFAGGLLGYLAAQGHWDAATFKKAVAVGTIMASFTIQAFSLAGLRHATRPAINARLKTFQKMLAL